MERQVLDRETRILLVERFIGLGSAGRRQAEEVVDHEDRILRLAESGAASPQQQRQTATGKTIDVALASGMKESGNTWLQCAKAQGVSMEEIKAPFEIDPDSGRIISVRASASGATDQSESEQVIRCIESMGLSRAAAETFATGRPGSWR